MRYKQGKFVPKNPSKYVGDVNNIIFRSGLELKFFHLADNYSNILEWGSEVVIVPYISDFDNKSHRYFTDLYLKVRDKQNNIQKYLVEIKPMKFTKPPRLPRSGRKTKGYLLEAKNWIVNNSKWKYAKEFAERNNMKFIIMTEKDLK